MSDALRPRQPEPRIAEPGVPGDDHWAPDESPLYPPPFSRNAWGVVPVCLRKKRAKWEGSAKVRS
jgi:hypothetical protein